jgi:cell division septation protein DedD
LLIAASKQLILIPPGVVDDAKKLVEASLAGYEAETEADSGSMTDAGVSTTILKEHRADGAAGSGPVLSNRTGMGEEGPATIRPRVSVFDKRMKTTLIIVASALLLLLMAGLTRLFVNDHKVSTFSPPLSPTVQQKPTVPPEKNTADIQTLRDEPTDKPSGQAPGSTTRTDAMTTVPTEPSSKQAGGVNAQPSVKGETATSGIGRPIAFHPFSLRLSSYQQQERAYEEISEIKQLGLTPYLVKADVGDIGTLWRIYIGFYSTEEEAKKIKTMYKLTNASIQKTEYACQVGDFSNETEILIVFDRLKQSGYSPYVIQKDRNRFRLYAGAHEKRAEAEVMRQDLQKKGISSQVVKR